jgi:trigger factor
VVDHEAEHVIEDLGQRLSQQGLDLDTYFKMQGTDREKFLEEEARPVAVKRLERSLIMDELARAEKIELQQVDLQSEYGQTLNELQFQGLNPEKIKGGRQGQQQFAEAVAMQSASRLLTRRTLERIKAIATGEYKEEPEGEEKPEGGKKAKGGTKAKKTAGGKKSAAKKASAKKTAKKSAAKKKE